MRNALMDRSERSIPQRGLDLAAGELADEVDGSGVGLAYHVLLPNEGKSIDDMMRVVNAKEIANLGRKMENCKVDLKLPKFTTESRCR